MTDTAVVAVFVGEAKLPGRVGAAVVETHLASGGAGLVATGWASGTGSATGSGAGSGSVTGSETGGGLENGAGSMVVPHAHLRNIFS